MRQNYKVAILDVIEKRQYNRARNGTNLSQKDSDGVKERGLSFEEALHLFSIEYLLLILEVFF
jgi:hypothetical protein